MPGLNHKYFTWQQNCSCATKEGFQVGFFLQPSSIKVAEFARSQLALMHFTAAMHTGCLLGEEIGAKWR